MIQQLIIKIYRDLLLKNGSKFMINQKEIITLTKKLELTKEIEEIYIPPEKRQQIIDDLRLI